MFEKLLPFDVAHFIMGECNKYQLAFKATAKRAHVRFENQDWQGIQAEMKLRLTLYRDYIGNAKIELAAMLGDRLKDPSVWRAAKPMYEDLAMNLYYRNIAETFYNSVFRHVHRGLTLDNELVFVLSAHDKLALHSARPIFHTYASDQSVRSVVSELFNDFKFDAPYEDLERDISLVSNKIVTELLANNVADETTRLEVLKSLLFRNKAAYIVGRAHFGERVYPFVIPLLNEGKGIFADALLLEYNHIASIFTYYRAHFLVDVDIPSEMVEFLHSILPHKPISELYTCLGFEKHGKTELYRQFLTHLEKKPSEKFEFAPGIKGMVMSVFTLPSFNMVFKIIKDHFAPPKNVSEKTVRAKYELVTQHDRVGRLADTHLFQNFICDKDRFSPELLAELRKVAKSKVILRGDKVEIKYLYVEKKMTPLNLYLDKANPEQMRQILNEYGIALRQLAAANIFPGDLLLKNFGVTRLNRVVFYDYDEIEWVTDCTFRELPVAHHHDDEMSGKPWFYVGDKDVFPEEFPPFLFQNTEIKDYFLSLHADLFTAQYWNKIKDDLTVGKMLDVFPYPESLRFGAEGWHST